MGGGVVLNCWVRSVVDFVCGIRTCAGVVSGGNSGGLGESGDSLTKNTSFGSWW